MSSARRSGRTRRLGRSGIAIAYHYCGKSSPMTRGSPLHSHDRQNGYTLVANSAAAAVGYRGHAARPLPEVSPPLPAATPAVVTAMHPLSRVHWSKQLWNSRLRRRALVAVGCIGVPRRVVAHLFCARRALGRGCGGAAVYALLVLPFDISGAKGLGRDVGVELADEIADFARPCGRLQISGHTSADTLAAAHTGALRRGGKSASMPSSTARSQSNPAGYALACG